MKRRIALLSSAAVALSLAAPGAFAQSGTSGQNNDQLQQNQPQQPKQQGQQQGQQKKAQPQQNQQAQPQQNQPQASQKSQQQGAQDQRRDQTTGQGQQQAQPQGQQAPQQQGQQAPQRQAPQQNQQATPNTQQNTQQGAQAPQQDRQQGQTAQQQGQQQNSGAIALNAQQSTRVSAAIRSQNVRPLTNVNFSVSVGTVVPASVRLSPLPAAIVEIAPQFRGHSFVLVRDQIVIIEPRTKKIVALMPLSGGARAQATTSQRTAAKIELTGKQRAAIRAHALKEKPASARVQIRAGDTVSREVVVHEFPEELVAEVPAIRSHRFFVQNRDVVIVDPAEGRAVEVLR